MKTSTILYSLAAGTAGITGAFIKAVMNTAISATDIGLGMPALGMLTITLTTAANLTNAKEVRHKTSEEEAYNAEDDKDPCYLQAFRGLASGGAVITSTISGLSVAEAANQFSQGKNSEGILATTLAAFSGAASIGFWKVLSSTYGNSENKNAYETIPSPQVN